MKSIQLVQGGRSAVSERHSAGLVFRTRAYKVPSFIQAGLARLKEAVREMYLEHEQTLKQLATYLEKHHGFKPT